jgi:hypothetical protein
MEDIMKNICVGLMFLVVINNSFAQLEAPDSVVNYDDGKYRGGYLLRCTAEGNFTNSGKREIIAFYQSKMDEYIEGKPHYVLSTVYCFILDDIENAILEKYEFDFFVTGPFSNDHNLLSMPLEALGRDIMWRGYSIGKISDFNGNGREELYLYILGGRGFFPAFFEFNPESNKFIQLLEPELSGVQVDIIKIETEKKQFDFRVGDQGNIWHSSYIWNEEQQKYIQVKGVKVVDSERPVKPEETVLPPTTQTEIVEDVVKEAIYTYDSHSEILSLWRVDFGVPEGDNWLVEWKDRDFPDGNPTFILYLIKDNKVQKDYFIGPSFITRKYTSFDIMKDIPGIHIGNNASSFYDFNEDGIEELFQYGFGGSDFLIIIKGYDAVRDEFVNYCLIPFGGYRIDPENGPAPVEFMTYKGMNGFKALYGESIVADGPNYVYEPMPDNDKWFFYTWDETTRKYVEVEEVVDEPLTVTEPIEAAVPSPAAEPEIIEDNTPAAEPVTVASNNPVFFVGIAAALLVGGILLVVLVLRKKRRKNA